VPRLSHALFFRFQLIADGVLLSAEDPR